MRLRATSADLARGGSRSNGPPAWTPAALFASLEQGAWYSTTERPSMYQDSDGATPAALNQPVGRLTDKSGNGNHLYQPTTTARPQFSARYNLLQASEDLSSGSWHVRGAVSVTAAATNGPDGTTPNGSRVDHLGDLGASDFYQFGQAPFGTSRLSTAVRLKRISTVGTLSIANPGGASDGAWTVDLSLLPDAWVTLTEDHAAVTVNTPFGTTNTATYGVQIGAPGQNVSVFFAGADQRYGEYDDSMPDYQKVGADSSYDHVGFLARLRFDGVDDVLALINSAKTFAYPVTVAVRAAGSAAPGIRTLVNDAPASSSLAITQYDPTRGNGWASNTGNSGSSDKIQASLAGDKHTFLVELTPTVNTATFSCDGETVTFNTGFSGPVTGLFMGNGNFDVFGMVMVNRLLTPDEKASLLDYLGSI